LEAEFEAEQRRSREAMAANRKLERLLAELKLQADEDHRVRAELQDQVNALQLKLKSLRRQLEEAVSGHVTYTTCLSVPKVTMKSLRMSRNVCRRRSLQLP
jgi:chromosome segregation ATPase